MHALILYASFSGNTEEVAELIKDSLLNKSIDVTLYRITRQPVHIPDFTKFDMIFFGSFTWAKGATPEIVKRFVYQIGYKPENIFVFGTGDTQFGGDVLFCKAADKLATFYDSPLPPLKIEQSPRGEQVAKVIQWTEGVVTFCNKYLKKLPC